MIADLKPYADYKESGLPWLGAVPAHWEVRRLKQIARLAYGDALPRTGRSEGHVQVFGSNGKVGWHSSCNTNGPCIIVGRKGSFGKVNFSADAAFVIDTAFLIDHRFTKADIRWLYYSLGWIGLDGASKDSAIPGLDREDAYQQIAPFPPPDEQAAIVRFLDWANGRLERAIRAKRKVIALLNEQKQAIIHRAVTRGLDPSVPLKPSGIPWLGDIPQHWEVRKLKHLTRFVNGLPFKPGDWKATGVPIIRIQNLNGSEAFNYTDRTDLPEELLIQPGDLMFAWSGNRGTSFGSFEWTREFPGYLNQHIFKLVGYTLPKRYFYYLLRAVTRHVEEQAGGIIGLVHVTKPELGSVYVPIAPSDEAEVLAREIDSATADIGRTISRLEREIELLREYRTRLVADVVTGKLDVREAALLLPDEAPLDAIEDDAGLGFDSEAADEEAAA